MGRLEQEHLPWSPRPASLLLGAFGTFQLVAAAFLLPLWPILGFDCYLVGGGWMAHDVILMSLLLWGLILFARAAVAHGMGVSRLYPLTTPLGSGLFAATMLT